VEKLGRYWASVEGEQVLSLIRMPQSDIDDKQAFRESARELLKRQGRVISGELVRRDDGVYLMKRLNHANRSKKVTEREPEYFRLI